jgi:hypothetical protein
MKIADKKEEIIKLIEKLNPKGQDPASDKKSGKSASSDSSIENISSRREKLIELRQQKGNLELQLLEERFLKIYQLIGDRLARIEDLLSSPAPALSGANVAQSVQSSTPTNQLDEDEKEENALLEDSLPDIDGIVAKTSKTYSLSGVIEEGVLADILQLISSNQKTGIFSTLSDDMQVELFFKEGNLFHASSKDLAGQEAFFVAMAITSGRFQFEETEELSAEQTIDGSTQFLILEALRQIDEESAGK